MMRSAHLPMLYPQILPGAQGTAKFETLVVCYASRTFCRRPSRAFGQQQVTSPEPVVRSICRRAYRQ